VVLWPRYLVPVLMVGVLPAWRSRMAARIGRSAVGIVGLSLLGLILAVSLRLQVCVNSLPFLRTIRSGRRSRRSGTPGWSSTGTRRCTAVHLLRPPGAPQRREDSLPLVVLEEILPERSRERLGRVSQVVEEHSKSNYFFFR